mgnify:CR=1 FL=1
MKGILYLSFLITSRITEKGKAMTKETNRSNEELTFRAKWLREKGRIKGASRAYKRLVKRNNKAKVNPPVTAMVTTDIVVSMPDDGNITSVGKGYLYTKHILGFLVYIDTLTASYYSLTRRGKGISLYYGDSLNCYTLLNRKGKQARVYSYKNESILNRWSFSYV